MSLAISIVGGVYIGISLNAMRTFSKRLKDQITKLDELLAEIKKYR